MMRRILVQQIFLLLVGVVSSFILKAKPLPAKLYYSSEANGVDPSRLANATSTLPRNGLSRSAEMDGGDENSTSSTIPRNGLSRPAGVNGGDDIRLTIEPDQVPLEDAIDNGSWTRNVYDYAKAAAGTLGDIMARGNEESVTDAPGGNISATTAVQRDGLVTNAISSGTLASRFGIENPLDRMALTANGNLQRLVSSYYDAPVEVIVDYCHPVEDEEKRGKKPFSINLPNGRIQPTKRWDRLVRLKVHNTTFCKAHSIITVYDPICQRLVESGEVGLGQLFRYYDILPEFELHNAGPYPTQSGGGFWREYTLKCQELSCDIHEDFAADIWNIRPSR